MDLLAADGQAQTGLGFIAQKWRPSLREVMNAIDARVRALIAGMLRENWRAFRIRIGPRSRLSALVGMYERPLFAKLVATSMNMVAAVMVPASMPVT